MAHVKPFVMDGIEYNVNVMELTRKFSVLDSAKSGRTQNGNMYRDPIGTFYNYSIVIEQRGGDYDDLDALWDAMSQPTESHVCTFPYNQVVMSQRMYVTSGEQKVRRIHGTYTEWDSITINFIAMEPKAVAE